MKKNLLILCIMLVSTNSFADTSVTSHAITWYFDADYPVGRYISGDYYVVAPYGLKITSISPDGEGKDANGSMINPTPGATQGYTNIATNYSRAVNAGYTMPLTLSAGDSLVSTETETLYQTHVKDASVLTVVASAPAAGSFRPPFCGIDKPVHNINEINWSALANLTPIGIPPTQSNMERSVERPWINHGEGAGGSWITPFNNMPNYGREQVTEVAQLMLWLNLDYPRAVKQQTLYNFLQIGLDYYYQMIMPEAKRLFAPDGGVWGSQKGHILFTGKVLDNSAILSIGQRSGDYIKEGTLDIQGNWTVPSDYIHFQHDGQTFYVGQKDIDITHSVFWNPKDSENTDQPYTLDHLGMPEWSIRYADTINQSNADWSTLYRTNASFDNAAGIALAAYIMNFKKSWNHDAFFDYVDRYMAIANGHPDPFGYTVNSEHSGHLPAAFVAAMWDAYRNTEFIEIPPPRDFRLLGSSN